MILSYYLEYADFIQEEAERFESSGHVITMTQRLR
jgi:hypothetical protein